jgi:hypothetical protein
MSDYDDDLDPQGPSREDMERFGDEFVTCPECKSLVYDQAEVCQACGRALHGEAKGPPLWALGVGAALLAAMVVGYVLFWR